MRAPAVGLLSIALAALTACGTTATTRPSDQATAVGGSALHRQLAALESATWVKGKDAGAGITFALPNHIRSQPKNGGIIYANVLDGHEPAVSVGVVPVDSPATANTAVDQYASAINAQFHAVPGTPADFAVTERAACTMGGHRCTDMRVGFTPISYPDETTLWLVRVVAVGNHVILIQTIIGAPKTEANKDLVIVRALQAKAIAALALP